MRVLLLADYWAGLQVAKLLKESIVGLVVPPVRTMSVINRGYSQKIVDLLDLPTSHVFDSDQVQAGECLGEISALKPDIFVVVFWSFILKPEFIAIPPQGCINLHCSYLPYNRGKNPNVWPIMDGTPAGVSIHYIDRGVDTGDIIAQSELDIEPIDTGQTLYGKLVREIVDLFKLVWPKIEQGAAPRIEQLPTSGTHHFAKDLSKIDIVDLEKKYKASELLDILRARTFPPFPSAYFVDASGRKIYVRVQLQYASDSHPNDEMEKLS